MFIICSYCQHILGEKVPFSDCRETHGICPTCRDRELDRIRNLMPLQRHFDEREVGK